MINPGFATRTIYCQVWTIWEKFYTGTLLNFVKENKCVKHMYDARLIFRQNFQNITMTCSFFKTFIKKNTLRKTYVYNFSGIRESFYEKNKPGITGMSYNIFFLPNQGKLSIRILKCDEFLKSLRVKKWENKMMINYKCQNFNHC